ncbi:MAG: poly-gamma-glutamate hydrolase family protein [Acidimicrobiia bacterium]
MLAELLGRDDVREELTVRSRFGFMAFHGGTLEKATDVVAREAAEASGASYYGVVQYNDDPVHITSTEVTPTASVALAQFFASVDVVITVHGYGRPALRRCVLLGGRNRDLADHIAEHARAHLPDFTFHTDLTVIPRELAGQHSRNPVNLPVNRGVQLELPADLRWNFDEAGWSDHDGTTRAPQLNSLIAALAAAARSWSI